MCLKYECVCMCVYMCVCVCVCVCVWMCVVYACSQNGWSTAYYEATIKSVSLVSNALSSIVVSSIDNNDEVTVPIDVKVDERMIIPVTRTSSYTAAARMLACLCHDLCLCDVVCLMRIVFVIV